MAQRNRFGGGNGSPVAFASGRQNNDADDDCPDDGCPDRPQFPNFGSYAFREAYYDVDSGATAAWVSSVLVIGLAALQLLR